MTAIDWSRPLVTNAGKVARVVKHDPRPGPLPYFVAGVYGDRGREDVFWTLSDGTSTQAGYFVRNATPSEILANPEAWPDHQEWAERELSGKAWDAAMLASNPQPTNWLTPETAMGATLPCGAKVERVEICPEIADEVTVYFDRVPIGGGGGDQPKIRQFSLDGSHVYGDLPNLTPPPAQPEPGVMVTREMLRKAIGSLPDGVDNSIDALADALGLPPEPPKVAPWEEAYEALSKGGPLYDERATFKAGVEWAMTEACNAMGFAAGAHGEIRRRIMGDQA